MDIPIRRLIPAAISTAFAAQLLLTSPKAHAAPAPSRKVGFIGCMAKPEDAELGSQISKSLEKRLVRARVPGFEFVPEAVARGRASLKGGPVNPQRIVAAGQAMGADKVIVCLITYKRERAATAPGETKTRTVTRDETQYVEEVYYKEVPNPDYEEPLTAAIPMGNIGPIQFSALLGTPKTPKTIQEKHVRRVPQKRRISEQVAETAEATEKPGYVRLQASYIIVDVASGKMENRDTVSYFNEIAAIFDSMESDKDLRSKAGESTVASLERSVLAKLPSTSGK